MKKHLIFIGLILLSATGIVQAQQSIQGSLWVKEGKDLMAKMEYDKAETIFRKALSAAPRDMETQYGLAMACYRQKKYDESIKYGEEILKAGGYEPNYYRMLGNSYDLAGDYEKGLAILEKGLRVHKFDGNLYFDMGVMALERSKYQEALDFWEQGIATQPPNAENYYLAAKIYAESDQPIWALVYGELFLNIERGTERFDEISKVVYDTYSSYVQNNGVVSNPKFRINRTTGDPFLEAQEGIYKDLLSKNRDKYLNSGKTEDGQQDMILTISNLRTNFVQRWNSEYAERFPTALYDMHKLFLQQDFFEAYNYWMFSKPASELFGNWTKNSANSTQYQNFINFYLMNPLKIGFDSYLVRTNFINN